ncbi:MAG: hypothetical protein ACFE95_14615 [Candidatus Hodarchaeota archaeon]
MDTNSINLFSQSKLRGVTTRFLLLRELQKAKERLNSTPYPYCELDCPWLILCRELYKKNPQFDCIFTTLTDSNLWRGANNRLSGVKRFLTE